MQTDEQLINLEGKLKARKEIDHLYLDLRVSLSEVVGELVLLKGTWRGG